ncbi:MAG: S8 family serine peptidase [Woeseiaceae bacterium]
MMRGLAIAMLLIGAGSIPAFADAGPGTDAGITKILVTFSDVGMSNATRAGPPGPGYRRRSSTYLASVSVKRSAKRIAHDFGLVTLDEWPIIPLKVHCLVYGVADDVAVDELLLRLRDRPEVESAQLLNMFELMGTSGTGGDDPYSKLQHNLSTLELTQAHNWSLGDGTNVTIIDTGVDLYHPELKTQIASHHDFVEDNDSDFSADAHGTAVAGVIGAAANNGTGMIGVAPSTRLSVLKACWHEPDRSQAICDSFTLAKALSYAIESDTDVINLSLAGPSDALLGRLAGEALRRGIVVVAAAPGQTGSGFPGEIAGVIVVGSNDQINSRNAVPSFPINAPGDDILVPVPRGGYDYASGSSLAAAHVSGIVALLVARRPGLTSSQISSLLMASRPTVDESVNACRALAQLLQRSGCKPSEAISQTF